MNFPDNSRSLFFSAKTTVPWWLPSGAALFLFVLFLTPGCKETGDRHKTSQDGSQHHETARHSGRTDGGTRSPDGKLPEYKGSESIHTNSGASPSRMWQIEPGPDESTRTVQDMLGRRVSIPNDVTRVIGLRAGALRMIAYLDAVDLVAGVEEPELRSDRPYLSAYPQLKSKPAVGPQMGGDPELLAAAAPDLIFMTFTTRGQADALQARINIPVIALDYGDFSGNLDTFFESLRLMAAVIDRRDRADSLISGMRKSMDDLIKRTSAIPPDDRPRVYIGGVSYRGAKGITSTEPFYPPFRLIHAHNVAESIDPRLVNPIQGTYIDKEQLLIWNPEVLFLDLSSLHTAGPELRAGSPLAATLEAVRNGRIYGLLPYNNYAANYEAILANAWYAGHVLYPELFEDQVLSDQLNRIFILFLGKNVYDEISSQSGGGFRRLDPDAF